MATDRGQDGDQDDSGIQKRRERYGMLWEDLFQKDMKDPIVPGSPAFEAMRAWLKSYNEMVRRMTEALREPAPDLDTLIDSVTEHSGPAHILPGPAGLETLWEALVTRPDVPYGPEPGFPLIPEPPRAEAEAEPEGRSSDDLTWRQKPGLL
jgi:hypothetical protein